MQRHAMVIFFPTVKNTKTHRDDLVWIGGPISDTLILVVVPRFLNIGRRVTKVPLFSKEGIFDTKTNGHKPKKNQKHCEGYEVFNGLRVHHGFFKNCSS